MVNVGYSIELFLHFSRYCSCALIPSSPRVTCNILLNEDESIKAEHIPSISVESAIKHIEWLTVESSTLRKGTLVMLEYSDETPVFGLVGEIFCFEASVLLHVYNAFVIKSSGEFLVNLWCLQDYRPVSVKSSFSSSDSSLCALMPYYY